VGDRENWNVFYSDGMSEEPHIIVDRDGHVVGAWQRRIAPGAVTIRPAFFEPPSAADVAAFEAAAGEFAASLGLPAEIQWDA